MTSVGFPKGAHSLGNIRRTLHPPESRKNRREISVLETCKSDVAWNPKENIGEERIFFSNRSCIIIFVVCRGPARREKKRGEVSSRLTNLVFPVRTKDQPLDKSVFIRNEGRPSSIYQRCPVHYSLSFLRGCIPIHQRPPFVLSLRPLWSTSLARRNSNFAPRQLCNLAELSTHRLIRSNQSSIWNSSKESLCKEERRKRG